MVDINPAKPRRRPASSRLLAPVDETYFSAFSPTPVTLKQAKCATAAYGKRARLCFVGERGIGAVFPRRKAWIAVQGSAWSPPCETIGEAVDHLIKGARP